MRFRAFKYLSPLLVYAGSLYSFMTIGWAVWLPLVYAWIIIPFWSYSSALIPAI